MSRKRKGITPKPIEQDLPAQKLRMQVLSSESKFDPQTYEYDESFIPGDPNKFHSVHTIPELMECLDRNESVEAEGTFLEANSEGVYRYRKFSSKAEIKEAWKANAKVKKFREAKIKEGSDSFATAGGGFGGAVGANAGLVGDDFLPLLGGPFNKQLYLTDYLRMQAACFEEYNHHPFAKAIIHITRDFVLGGGFSVECDDPKAFALWKAFEDANRLDELMESIVVEGSLYGENMIWWLPNQETFISYQDLEGQEPKKGIIPRIRLIDPSTCWEIVTFPEDIKRVLYYQLVFPTQYQIYTGSVAGKPVPTSKFVMQQIPAQDMMHFKYNAVSNEKRGRSDLFAILGYLKWVKDVVNYKLISLKKQAAWTEDISVEGSQTDVDNLAQSLANLGEFEPAGSRFIHTSKIVRQYMANQGSGGTGDDSTLMQGINMIAVGAQIPVSYFGLQSAHGGGSTRASAIVGTEPVAKKFERRQEEVRRIIKAIWKKFQDNYGIKGAECKVNFPEIITQDSSQKIKDIKLIEDSKYISRRTAAIMAAKEAGVDDYDYDAELDLIKQEEPQPLAPTVISPLTAPSATTPAQGSGQSPAQPKTPSPSLGNVGKSSSASNNSDSKAVPPAPKLGASSQSSPRKPSALTKNDRRAVVMRDK